MGRENRTRISLIWEDNMMILFENVQIKFGDFVAVDNVNIDIKRKEFLHYWVLQDLGNPLH